jgi:hypothetical protein
MPLRKMLFMHIFSGKYLSLEVIQMSTLRKINLELEVGQTILVGPNSRPAQITKIEYHENTGEIALNTTRGPRRALTFRLTGVNTHTGFGG